MVMLRLAAISLAAAPALACDTASLAQQAVAIEATCGAQAPNGAVALPKTCSKQCAPAFNVFWDDCGAFLKYLPTFSTEFEDFAQKCQHQAPPSKPTDACGSGKLLQTMFFECSNVDNNNATQFCGSKCERGVEDFVSRCGKTALGSNAAVLKQAQQWLGNCARETTEKKCHAVQCGGPHEAQCASAHAKDSCDAITKDEHNVICEWKHCDEHTGPHSPPPPPPPLIIGCRDKTAINFNPTATRNCDKCCVFGGNKPPTSTTCTATRPYGCSTKAACEGVGMQWLTCQMLETELGDKNACQHRQGECVRKCAINEPQNCHTSAACEALNPAGQKKVQWYMPPELYHPPCPPGVLCPEPRPPTGRCERACDKHSTYLCHNEADCKAVGKQWVPPSRPIGAGSATQYLEPGRCTELCTKQRFSECFSEQACKSVGMQWTYSECCGTGCPETGIGRCERPCNAQSPYSCRTEVQCESIGRQWVPRTIGSVPASGCHGPQASAGQCELPCTKQNYYDCKSQEQCEAVEMEWHPEKKHVSTGGHIYTEPARCEYPCSIMNYGQCDTREECEGIGFVWVPNSRDAFGGVHDEDGGHCEKVCSASNPFACHNQADCEATGSQWLVEDICEFPGPIIDPMPRPGGGPIIDPGFGGPCTVPNNGVNGPAVKKVGRCSAACSAANLFNCKDAVACAAALGTWRAFPSINGQPSTRGTCETGCSALHSYNCRDATSCQGIGGTWKQHNAIHINCRPGTPCPPPPPAAHYCDVTSAQCEITNILGQCAGSISGGGESYQLCNSQCGRYIVEHFRTCEHTPPKGMTKQQFTAQFAPIVKMCETIEQDPNMRRCADNADEAVQTMQRLCCTDDKDCAANGGVPTKCTGDCADAFIPYFEKCGGLMLTQKNDPSSLAKFYEVCTASHASAFTQDKKLCSSNSGNAPFTAIEFRDGCSIYIKYVDAQTKRETTEFVRLVSVGSPPVSIQQLMATAKTVCGRTSMVKRLAEDMSGLMALSDIDESDSMILTVNHPATGNVDVAVTNNGENRDAVHKYWTKHYNVNTFNPDKCGGIGL